MREVVAKDPSFVFGVAGMEFERIEVQSRDEYREAQEPVGFNWRGEQYEIVQIVDRWYEGYVDSRRVPLRYFRVRTREGGVFILRYNEVFAAWAVVKPPKEAKE
jgi:hypothetical protein